MRAFFFEVTCVWVSIENTSTIQPCRVEMLSKTRMHFPASKLLENGIVTMRTWLFLTCCHTVTCPLRNLEIFVLTNLANADSMSFFSFNDVFLAPSSKTLLTKEESSNIRSAVRGDLLPHTEPRLCLTVIWTGAKEYVLLPLSFIVVFSISVLWCFWEQGSWGSISGAEVSLPDTNLPMGLLFGLWPSWNGLLTFFRSEVLPLPLLNFVCSLRIHEFTVSARTRGLSLLRIVNVFARTWGLSLPFTLVRANAKLLQTPNTDFNTFFPSGRRCFANELAVGAVTSLPLICIR